MQTRPWETIDNFGVNRLPARATFSPAIGTGTPCEASVSLGGDWLFHFDPSPEEAPQGFEAPDYDDSHWDHIPVPSNWPRRRPHFDFNAADAVPAYYFMLE